ncbi:MAG TPA: hypothetical protein VK157_06110 [Phycisphaerales bacterium]|nr:hypothetical protein [Phycisphaerales bacterium]
MNKFKTGIAAMMLVACCGSVVSAQQRGQNEQQPRQQQEQRDQRQDDRSNMNRRDKNQQAGALKLSYFNQLKGTNVKGADNSTVFEIKDVIFDRHSGDIAGYVVSDDRVVAPGELTAVVDDDGKIQMRTSLTKDAMKARMEFDDDAFDTKAGNSPTVSAWWNRFAAESKKQINSDMPTYHPEKIKSTDRLDVRGTIDSLDRVRGEGSTYRTIATIREEDGNVRTVVLGPTWYLADERVLPVRGQKVELTVVPLETSGGDEGEQWVASRMRIDGGKSIVLRDGDALAPVWFKNGDTDNAMSVQRRMLLATSLSGDDVKCREESSGEVENLVIDHNSNRVLALVIDPNENFMGAADTLRLIPLSVASPSSDDLVYVDADKSMIVNAPAAPSNLADLNNAWKIDSMFKQRPIANR